jgi:hypothetical protein
MCQWRNKYAYCGTQCRFQCLRCINEHGSTTTPIKAFDGAVPLGCREVVLSNAEHVKIFNEFTLKEVLNQRSPARDVGDNTLQMGIGSRASVIPAV